MTTATDWIDPVHDAAGNMTTIPKPAAPDEGFTATYDAWNRLVKLETLDGQQQTITVAKYEYDGQNQRIVKNTLDSGSLAEVRHFYYNDRWQCFEERLEGIASGAPNGTISANPICRYVWGTRYVDELLLRQRDTDANGSLDETLYALQDANFNVVALVDTSGNVVERYTYDAYGKATVRNANFTLKGAYGLYTDSAYAWEFLYTTPAA